jgi:hypothetical protein
MVVEVYEDISIEQVAMLESPPVGAKPPSFALKVKLSGPV